MIESPKTLFECEVPRSGGDMEFRRHPNLALETTKNGGLRFLDEDSGVEFDPKLSMAKLVWECWSGELLPRWSGLIHKNQNPWDSRYENLSRVSHKNTDYAWEKKKFFEATVNEMVERSKKFRNKNDAEKYFLLLGLKKDYLNAWKQRIEVKAKKKVDSNLP